MQIIGVLSWALVGSAFALTMRPTVVRYAATSTIEGSPAFGFLEAGTAALFAAFAYRFGQSLELLAYSSLGGFGVPLATIDLMARKLPNTLLGAAYSVLAAVFGVDAVLDAHGGSFLRATLAMTAILAIHGILYTFGTIAGGDVKLAGLLGAALGWISWEATWSGLVLGWLLGGVVVGTTRITRKRLTSQEVPLGPFLLAGALLWLLAA
jgi:leader peptidase (prepilin peptidase)/N-methyltransferase